MSIVLSIVFMRTLTWRWLRLGLSLAMAAGCARGQTTAIQASESPTAQARTQAGSVRGVVKSGNMPIPGATVVISAKSAAPGSSPSSASPSPSSPQFPSKEFSAALPLSEKITVWTDIDGSYSAMVPSYGTYSVRVQMVAFANAEQTVVVDAGHSNVLADFELTLLSRAGEASPLPREAGGRRNGGQAGGQRGFQNLLPGENLGTAEGGTAISEIVPSGMPVPGIDPNSATESIRGSGNNSNAFNSMSGDQLEQRINEARASGTGFGGGGGFGGAGGGGFGGGGGGGGGGRGRRRFDVNRPHGSVYYGIGDSALNAAPYALAGEPSENPSYMRDSFGGSVGGPLNIPHIYHGGTKTFYFVNYNGGRGGPPFAPFSIVPTLDERSGKFSALCKTGFTGGVCNDRDGNGNVMDQIYQPGTATPFANNMITQINSAATGLLPYIPQPNVNPQPGNFQNFHLVTSANSSSDDCYVRVNLWLGGARAR